MIHLAPNKQLLCVLMYVNVHAHLHWFKSLNQEIVMGIYDKINLHRFLFFIHDREVKSIHFPKQRSTQ